MITSWKYTDNTMAVVTRALDSGEVESCLVSVIADWVAAGGIPLPPDAAAIPTVVTPLQARLALDKANLLQSVNAAISTSSVQAQLAWQCATVVDRNSAYVQELVVKMGFTPAQLDQLFLSASTFT